MTFLLSILFKSSLLCCLVLAIVLMLKKAAAATRHWVISLSLLSLLLLPIFQYSTPNLEIEVPISAAFEPLESVLTEAVIASPSIPMEAIEGGDIEQAQEIENSNIFLSTDTEETRVQAPVFAIPNMPFSLNWAEIMLAFWLLGVVFFLTKSLLGVFGVLRITNRAKSFTLRNEHQNLLPLRRKVQYSVSDEIKTPMTWGIFAPKILLPTTHRTWTSDEMRVVLLHELSHIKRHDYVWHLLGLLTLSLYWLHPLVWILQKWQQSEREQACDEYVLRAGISKTDYAQQLVKVARQIIRSKGQNWKASLPMAQSSETKKRVFAILNFDAAAWRFTRWLQWRWLGIFGCSLPLLAAVHPATRTIIEESLPQIEAALEQPIFEASFDKDSFVKVESIAFLPKKKIQITSHAKAVDVKAILKEKVRPKREMPSLASLSQKPLILPQINTPLLFDVANRRETLPRYGTWTNTAGERIQLWTRGVFDLVNEVPYFTNLSEDALIIIEMENAEEKRTLVVNRASYDSKTYSDPEQQNRRLIRKDQIAFHCLVNDVFQASVDYDDKFGFKNYILKGLDSKLTFEPTEGGKITLNSEDINTANWESDEMPDWKIAIELAKSEGKKLNTISSKGFIQLLGQVPIKTWDDYPNWASRLEANIAPVADKMLNISDANIWKTINLERPLSHWETMMGTYTTILAHRLEPLDSEARKIQEDILNEQAKIGKRKAKQYKKSHNRYEELPLPNVYNYIPSGFLYLTETRKRVMPHFFMMEVEVSNSFYQKFLDELIQEEDYENKDKIRIHNENWSVDAEWNEPYVETYHTHPAYQNYPVVNVSYEGATAYCAWLTKKLTALLQVEKGRLQVRLPTRDEWMYAALGGHKHTPYPWGSYYLRNSEGRFLCNFRKIDESSIKYDASTDKYEVKKASNQGMRGLLNENTAIPATNRSYSTNAYGLFHMSGNVAEMLLEKGSTKGGSWGSTGYYVRIDAEDEYTNWNEPSPFIGFRPVVVIE